jgi:uncharacterized protein YggU (UPF0235/DUF167 family)
VTIRLKVQPRAKRAGFKGLVAGIDGPRLGLAVSEAAEDGKANRAVCGAIAKALGVTPSAVDVVQGAASREKLLRVTGNPATLTARLEEISA